MTSAPGSGLPSAGTLLVIGVAATLLLAVSSWSVAALPVGRRNEWGGLAWTAYYGGLVACCASWLAFGLHVRAGSVAVAQVRRFVLVTGAPLLAAAPFGRDLWAYAAQGHLTGRGLDPYRTGPSAVPGAFTDEVSRRWVDTPAPYGPAWLRISQLGAWLSDGHPAVAVVLLRLPAYLGLVLCCWAVTRLAQHAGARADIALWLGPACPLLIVLGIGGGHNDVLAIGLASAGLAVATGRGVHRLVVGAAVTGLAVMIKSPALVAVAFSVPVWLVANPGPPTARRVVAIGTAAASSALAVVAVVTSAAGLGSGWTGQVGADAPWTSTLSLPTAVGLLGRFLTGRTPVEHVPGFVHTSRTVGELVAVAVVVVLWFVATRRAVGRAPGHPVGPLAGAMAAAVLLAPAVQPWYYLWAILPAALVVRRHRSFVALATVGLIFAIMIMPSGTGWEGDLRFPLVVLVAAVVVTLTFRESGVVRPGSDRPAHDDGPRTDVRSGHGPDR